MLERGIGGRERSPTGILTLRFASCASPYGRLGVRGCAVFHGQGGHVGEAKQHARREQYVVTRRDHLRRRQDPPQLGAQSGPLGEGQEQARSRGSPRAQCALRLLPSLSLQLSLL
jgi:hypothetical protein